jgi:hypothetical protein
VIPLCTAAVRSCAVHSATDPTRQVPIETSQKNIYISYVKEKRKEMLCSASLIFDILIALSH